MQELSRRQLLKAGAGLGAAAALAGCAPVGPDAGMDGAAAMAEPIDLVVWYQDWDGANRIMG
ncbi:MAG: twin-arginine translocation signal domain-containing protein, partial [Caldilineaceae bacterium]|nr:twin-arginine translocation signal domain-containing protein [Caldilineaceae bacterium]